MDLNELSVTLDVFVLTLPPEIEVMADFHHNRSVGEIWISIETCVVKPNILEVCFRSRFQKLRSLLRYTSESSVSLNRSPGQSSSYRSDEELMTAYDRGAVVDG